MKTALQILLAVLALAASTATAAPPNVIIFYADDQGYQDLSCFGSPNLRTPNIDRLAREGVRFTDFYSAYCVCSASRASLMTGSYQPRISMPGVIGPKAGTALHPDEITIADLLKTKGYATACIGKWHLGDSPETLPTAQGFDSYFGYPYSNDMARKKGYGNNTAELDRIWKGRIWQAYNGELYRDTQVIESPVNQTTLTDRYGEEATKFIRKSRDQPFFLYFANTMPHVPLFVSDDRYDPDPKTAYKLTIEHIDAVVGRVLDTLDELGLAENTFVVYTSDNGPWLSKDHHGGSALPLRAGKTTTYEGGMRVSCVIRWPARIKAGATCRQVAATIDLLPTIASLVGAKLPADRPIDGLDITALLDNPETPSPHDTAGFFYYKNGIAEAVRLGPWKLRTGKVRQRRQNKTVQTKPELYNLREDISESKNLADQHPEIVAKLQKLTETYHARLISEQRPPWRRARK